jgi:flagellar FliJ protein
MTFSFRLQRILELREKAEQAKAQALVSAQNAADTARSTRDSLATLHEESRSAIAQAQTAEPRIGHLQQLGYALQSLDARLESASEEVDVADGAVANARELLEAAARDRRALDRLKDRHAEQWRNDETQKDRLHMDEIALARFSRTPHTNTEDTTTSKAPDAHHARVSTTNNGSMQ